MMGGDRTDGANARGAKLRIAVIGGGQSARWLLFALLHEVTRGVRSLHGAHVTVIEARDEFGTGLAWSRDYALDEHLASTSAPLRRCSHGDLQQRQFVGTVTMLREMDVGVTLVRGCQAVGLRSAPDRHEVILASGETVSCDIVVLATGHGFRPWPTAALSIDLVGDHSGVHPSPWPAKALADKVFDTTRPGAPVHERHVLILGSYLNAVDAALTLALRIGRFRTRADASVEFEAPRGVRFVMASRSGQLPRVWGHSTHAPYTPEFFCASRLQRIRDRSADPRFLSLDDALGLLFREMARSAGDDAGDARPDVPIRARVRAWQRLLVRSNRAALGHDLRAVDCLAAAGRAAGEAHPMGWQATIGEALQLWSESSPAFCAEDHLYFDRRLRTTFFNHLLPMAPDSARQIDAMMRSGHLTVVAVGHDYVLRSMADRYAGLALSFVDRRGCRHVIGFTDVIDATGYCTDIRRHPSPLMQGLLSDGAIQPAVRQFRDSRRAAILSDETQRAIVWEGDTAYLQMGGVFVNPATCAAVPMGTLDATDVGAGARLYAMGPLLIGQFADAQSLGQTHRDARRIASDICRRWDADAI